jgi:DNA-binding IclR family transcriptional regulator
MRQSGTKINSIEKALRILTAFMPSNEAMGTIEISQKLGFHKATVSRILLILTQFGFLQRDKQTKKFRLGHAVINLGLAVNQSINNNLVQIAKPYIDGLRDKVKETVILEVLSGETTVMAYIAEGPRLVRLAGNIGDRVPIHAAAGAKAILAFSNPDVRNALLDVKLHRFTEHTITERVVLLEQFKEIRRLGVSFDTEEIDEGTSAIGAPIFNHEEKPVASIVIAGPSQRITANNSLEMVSALKETAAKISARFYYKKSIPQTDRDTK